MISLKYVPSGLNDIIDYYGKANQIKSKLIRYQLPFSMRFAWNSEILITHSYIHPLVGPAVIDALQEYYDRLGLSTLRANNWERWGGCYNKRKMTGVNAMSTHSWGISVDINPDLAPMGGDPYNQPPELVAAFETRGFIWGGHWDRPDGMHFQACKDY